MSEQVKPQYLVFDWKIDVTFDLAAYIFTFFVGLPKSEPQPIQTMPPIGMSLVQIRKLHAQLGDLLELADRRGTPPPGGNRTQ